MALSYGLDRGRISVSLLKSPQNLEYVLIHILAAKGEELTISYTNSGRDYHQRNHELLKYYDFVCSCTLCKEQFKQGSSITPSGDLRVLLLELIDAGKPRTAVEIKEVEGAIEMMQDAGFGYK